MFSDGGLRGLSFGRANRPTTGRIPGAPDAADCIACRGVEEFCKTSVVCLGKIGCPTARVFRLLTFDRSSPRATPAGREFLRCPGAAQRNFSGALAERPCSGCFIRSRNGFNRPTTLERSSLVVPCAPARTGNGLFFESFLYFFSYRNIRRSYPTG